MLSTVFLLFILCFNGSSMADSPSSSSSYSEETIQTSFKLPSPLPTWPSGGEFASGAIDLGGLQVSQVTTFKKIWGTNQGGPDNLGATFYDPDPVPLGFSILSSYGQPNNIPFSGHILVGKDVGNNLSNPTLKPPVDYTLVWSSESKKDSEGYIWLPTPPEGYNAVGFVATSSPEKPPADKIRCVRADLTDSPESDTWVWGPGHDLDLSGFNLYGSTQKNGNFMAQNGSLSCLKNVKGDLSSVMPNLNQINSLIRAYSPVIYFHPNEPYLPSSVEWFFQNGALVYHKGDESKPNRIDPNGSNLPQGGSNDGMYWMDLPQDGSTKDRVKKGDLQNASAYFHVKPKSGGLFTDIAIWVFYPFNGGSRAKVEFIDISLGKLGEHVGDWEHVTLRISNLNGALHSVFFSQHSWGKWVVASALEFQNSSSNSNNSSNNNSNKPVVYASLHGHASYPRPGCVLLGSGDTDIGVRDDSAKSDKVMDTGVNPVVIAADHLGSEVVEPSWLNYLRKWGPKIDYDVDKEINKMKRLMIGKIKKAFDTFVKSVPSECLGEDGPTGPKVKNSWSGDEVV